MKKINLLDIIERKILEYEKFNIGPKGGKAFSEFTREDFIYIFEYFDTYGKNMNVIHFISFCTKNIWSDINNLTFQNNLWNYDFDDINFLNIIVEKIHEIIESYFLLLKAGYINQAQTVFRNYLELSSILFACKMDKEFFFNYIDNFSTDDEYTKHWYKKLKPEKVKKTLKNLLVNNDSNKLFSQKFLEHTIDQFTGNQREILYSYSSSIGHAKFNLLKSKDKNGMIDILNISTDFLVNSTCLLKLIFLDEIRFENSKTERLHQIVFAVWIEILYSHILTKNT